MKLTAPRRNALMLLLEAESRDETVSISNFTSAYPPGAGDQLHVYWQTAQWLVDQALVHETRIEGRQWLTLTAAGRAIAAEEIALELDDV